ncbi:hypothetical protein X777_00017, partial [Ooceraea biroi]
NKLRDDQHTGVVYKIDCLNCDACYTGQTKGHLETRIKEHKSDILEKKKLSLYICTMNSIEERGKSPR